MNTNQPELPAGVPYPVKPYNTKELANLYGMDPRIFAKWLLPFKQEIGERVGYYYNVVQVERIFSFLGPPYKEEKNK